MKKSDKKLENELIKELTVICERYKAKDIGFSWLTHSGRLTPLAIKITCVFLGEQQLATSKNNNNCQFIEQEIRAAMKGIFGPIQKQQLKIEFDSE